MPATSAPEASVNREPARFRFLPHCLLLLLVALVWGHTVRFDFVWDDRWFIEELQSIRSLRNVPQMFTSVDAQSSDSTGFKVILRPLRTVVYAVLFQIGGGEPPKAWLYHLCNVFWHGAAVLLLYAVALRFLARDADTEEDARRARRLAWLTAAGFAVSPVVSEVVCWAKSLDDIMATTFTLAALRCLLGPQLDRRAYLTGLGWFVLAVYSKISAVPFGVFCFFLFRFWHQFSFARAARLALGFLVVGGAFVIHKRLVCGRSSHCDPISGSYGQTLVDMLPVLGKYVRLLLGIPPFCADYTGMKGGHALTSAPVLAGLVLLVGLAVFAVWAIRRPGLRVAGLGLAWAGIFLLPVSNLMPMLQYMAERFLYLPLVGWLLALGALLARSRRDLLLAAYGVVLVAWMGTAFQRSLVWRDNLTLFVDGYQAAPGPGRMQDNAVAAVFRLPALKDLFRQHPQDKSIYFPVSDANIPPPAWLTARETLREALKLIPNEERLLTAAGIASANVGDHESAVRAFRAAAEQHPERGRNWANLGRALNDAGHPDEAVATLRQALKLEPGNLSARHSLAAAHWMKNDFAAALEQFEQLRKLEPNNPDNQVWIEKAREKLKAQPEEKARESRQ